jgi:tRNA pseudouridine38-40 synthase
MQTFKITLAYDGTDFVGWQRQASGTSIQGLLEDALGDLDQQEVVVIGAGRTDAGVHALGQAASFKLARWTDAGALVGALNARLPAAVRVLTAGRVSDAFHARFGATKKTYRYRIWNADVLSPFERHWVWHITRTLDWEAMAAAARLIEGRHDFEAFRAAGGSTRSTVREVYSSCVFPEPPASLPPGHAPVLILYEITGNGFLRHMVRALVGTLVEIGRGRRPVEWMREVLAGRDRALAGPTAPPQGLVLVGVEYDAGLLAAER